VLNTITDWSKAGTAPRRANLGGSKSDLGEVAGEVASEVAGEKA